MCVKDVLKKSSIVMQDDILGISRLITIFWQKNSYLLNSGIWWKVVAPIYVRIKSQSNCAVLFRGHLLCNLKGMLVELHTWMLAI
jgi:hypothetical protein